MLATRSGICPAEPVSMAYATWMAAFDRLALALLLLDRDGRELYATAAFKTMLAREMTPSRTQILKLAKQAACRQLGHVEPCETGAALSRLAPRASDAIHIRLSGTCRYTMRLACIDGTDIFATPVVVIVSLERRTLELPSAKVLSARFGLTRREAEVALLLAQRRQNGEIAATLCVSAHTARHHTEHVMEKLGIQRRTQVMPALQNMYGVAFGVIMLCLLEMSAFVFSTVAAGLAV